MLIAGSEVLLGPVIMGSEVLRVSMVADGLWGVTRLLGVVTVDGAGDGLIVVTVAGAGDGFMVVTVAGAGDSCWG